MTGKNRLFQDSGRKSANDLEARLHQEPTPDMDLEDFSIIAGINCYLPMQYRKGNEDFIDQIREKYNERRKGLSKSQRSMETSVYTGLISGAYRRKIKTIRELKNHIETYGVLGQKYKSLAVFNDILKQYHMEPITVGKAYGYQKAIREAGLELTPNYTRC